jgi:hypothetical protein
MPHSPRETEALALKNELPNISSQQGESKMRVSTGEVIGWR